MKLPLDDAGEEIQLLAKDVPLAVTRKTDLTTAAADIVALNASTKLVRCYADSFDAYIYFYGTGRTATVSTSVRHRFVPAGQIMDFIVPENTTKITGIAEGACPKFIVSEMG